MELYVAPVMPSSNIQKNAVKETLRKYNYLFNKPYTNLKANQVNKYPNKIWTFWHQEESEAPVYIRRCIESMRKHSCGREVIVLNAKNIKDYIDIPENIMVAFNSGNILPGTFVNILAAFLLYEYGGTFFNSTMYLSDAPKEFFDLDFEPSLILSKKNRRECTSNHLMAMYMHHVKEPGHYYFYTLRQFAIDHAKNFKYYWPYYIFENFASVFYEEDARFYKIVNDMVDNNKVIHNIYGTQSIQTLKKLLPVKYNKQFWNLLKSKTKIHKLTVNAMNKKYSPGSLLDKLIRDELD